MKIVIIDDERAMHLVLKRMLAKLSGVEITGFFDDTNAAFTYLMDHKVDLILLDINMPRESGLNFAERLRESGIDTKIVFITSHREYAIFAFDVQAYDYIVKPVVQERLHKTVLRKLAEMSPSEVKQAPIAPKIKFSCLGCTDIESSSGVRVKWKTSKSMELFGYLLLHKGRPVSRERLVDDLFGHMPQKNAEIYLNTTVYQLRKVLDIFGLKEQLHVGNNNYTLNPKDIKVDFIEFEEGCRELPLVDETNLEQALKLEQLYAGNLFGDRAYAWAWNEVERLSLMYTALTQRLCTALLNKGETNSAIRLLSKLMNKNEMDEGSFMLLLRALALQGNKEAMIRRYDVYAENLYKEIGAKPSSEAIRLYESLLVKVSI